MPGQGSHRPWRRTLVRVDSVRLLGLDFADCDVAYAAEWVNARAADAPFGYVVTPNADHFVRLHRQPGLVRAYEGALLRLLDSRVVARTARLLGMPTPRVCPGSDLTAYLLTRCIQPGERIGIVGLEAPHVANLVQRLRIDRPLHYNPPQGFNLDPDLMQTVVDFVLKNPARLTFLATGSPRQEQLAAAIAATGQARGTALCIGSSLAFAAGAVKRAPRWMQVMSLEWLHRLAQDPKRLWRRYLRDSPAVFSLLAQERMDRALKTKVPSRTALCAARAQGFQYINSL